MRLTSSAREQAMTDTTDSFDMDTVNAPSSDGAPPSKSMTKTVVKGAIWTGLADVMRISSAVLVLPVMARILSPEDFGIMQLGMPIVLFVMIFNDFGLGPALVQARETTRQMWSSALWTNVGIAIVLTGLTFLAAPLIAMFFREPRAEELMRGLALVMFMNGLCSVPSSWLQRTFKFRELAMTDVFSVATGIAVAIVTALNGAGYWALVWQQVAMFVVRTILLWAMARTPIRIEYSFTAIKSLIGFSSNMVASRFVNFFAHQSDSFIIGRWVGVAALGYYAIAARIMVMPVQVFAYGLTRVLLPSMASMRDDLERMKAASMRTYRMIALIVFPAMAGIAALSYPLITFALGQKMAPAAPVLTILAIVGGIRALFACQGAMYMALGRSDRLFRWSVIEMILFVPALAIGVQWGLMGAVYAYLIAHLIFALPNFNALLQLLNANLGDLFKEVWSPLIGAAAMAAAVAGLDHWAASQALEDWMRLGLCIPAGVAVYVGVMGLIDRRAVREVLDLAKAVKSR